MYVATLRETPNSTPVVIHSHLADNPKVPKGVIGQGTNDINSFEFEIDYGNNGYDKIRPMKSLVEVRNTTNGYLEFSGRVISLSDVMDTNGGHVKSVVCENEMGYLHDSSPPYIEYSGPVEGLFTRLVESHNIQVEEYKRFEVGIVGLDKTINQVGASKKYKLKEGQNLRDVAFIHGATLPSTIIHNDITNWESIGPGDVVRVNGISDAVENTSKDIDVFITPDMSTFEAIKKEIIDVYGGEFQVRNEDGILYIDYVKSIGHESLVDIAISKNLQSVTKKNDPTNVITRLIPLGATISTEAQDDNEERVSLSPSNGKIIPHAGKRTNQGYWINFDGNLTAANLDVYGPFDYKPGMYMTQDSYVSYYDSFGNFMKTERVPRDDNFEAHIPYVANADTIRISIWHVRLDNFKLYSNYLNSRYIERPDLVDEFGIQTGVVVWDDVTDPEVLLARGTAWMDNQDIVLQQFTLDAIDLFKLGTEFEEFNIGNYHRLNNNIMNIDENIRVIKKTVDIVQPLNSSLTIGDKFKSLMDYQIEQRKTATNIGRLGDTVRRYNKSLKTISDSVNEAKMTIKNSSVETLPTDLIAINQQLTQIKNNVSNIPSYSLATALKDGLLSRQDKIKLDNITVNKKSNLDDLSARLFALESEGTVGTNLLANSDTFTRPWDTSGTITTDHLGGNKAVVTEGTIYGYLQQYANMDDFPPGDYRFSAWVKSDTGKSYQFRYRDGPNIRSEYYKFPKYWTKLVVEFTTYEVTFSGRIIDFYPGPDHITISYPKLERIQ